MPWTKTDSNEVIGMLSNFTTTMDAVGKGDRDLTLKLRVRSDWPDGLRSRVLTMIDQMDYLLAMGDGFESDCISLIKGYEQETT